MPSLDDHFVALTKIQTPDDWTDLDALGARSVGQPHVRRARRLRARPHPRQSGHPVAAAALALVVAMAGIGFAIYAFQGAPPSTQPPPAATVGNGKIAFVRGADTLRTISLVDPGGSDLARLIEGSDPAWSPDGGVLAFVTQGAGKGTRYIASVRVDGTNLTRLVPLRNQPGGLGPQAWSPDGGQLVFASSDGIYVMDADGTNVRPVTRYGGEHACYDLDPSWSPDGSLIVFAVMCEGGSEGLWTVGVDGSGRRRLISGDYELDDYRSPIWSPDGTRVAFVKTDWRRDEAIANAAIHTVDADGTDATSVVDGVAFDRSIAWSPDGRAIAFTRYDANGSDIFLVDLDSSEVTRLTHVGDAVDPAWQPVPAEEGTPTPEPTTLPEGTITVPPGAIPEGTLLLGTEAGAEILRAGSERSAALPGLRAPLDLSADGSMVVGASGAMGSPEDELVTFDLRSGESRVLVDPGGDEILGGPVQFSPDGTMVAYSLGAVDPAERSTLCVVSLDAGEPSCFPEVGRVYEFDWAPEGGRLVVAGPPVQPVRILDVATGEVSEIVAQEGDTPINDAIRDAGLGTSFQLVGPKWSPTGAYLAALANLEDSDFSYVPVVFTPDGQFVAFGQPSGEFPEPFAWSPNGDVLAYTRGEAPYRITESYLLDPATGEERVLLPGGEQGPFVVTDMAWAPSGRSLALGGWIDQTEGYVVALRIVDVADPLSFEVIELASELAEFLEAWGP
jgi:Tol biopolymer transport system component